MNTESRQNVLVPRYPQKNEESMWKEYTWVCTCKTGRHVESLDLDLGNYQFYERNNISMIPGHVRIKSRIQL
jgi:hypothetical protein